MKRRASRELFDYWNAVRRGRTAPTGASFDPSAVRDAMRQGFYLEIKAAEAVRFSWVGPELARGLPASRRGGAFLDVWARSAAAEATRLIELARRPCPVIAGVWGFDRGGASRVLEALLLPLAPDPRAPDSARLIGVFGGVDPDAPIEAIDGLSAFRILDDSPTPWRNAGIASRRRRDGWSARYAELAARAQAELGVRSVAAQSAEPGQPAPDFGLLRYAQHLTVLEGGRTKSVALV